LVKLSLAWLGLALLCFALLCFATIIVLTSKVFKKENIIPIKNQNCVEECGIQGLKFEFLDN